MWARHVEAMLGIWLYFSWLIFRYPLNLFSLRVNDWICACLIALFSLLSYHKRLRYLHLFNFLIGFWLIGRVFISGKGIDFPPFQNYMVIGLFLLMLPAVPSRTKEPPRSWLRYLSDKDTE